MGWLMTAAGSDREVKEGLVTHCHSSPAPPTSSRASGTPPRRGYPACISSHLSTMMAREAHHCHRSEVMKQTFQRVVERIGLLVIVVLPLDGT